MLVGIAAEHRRDARVIRRRNEIVEGLQVALMGMALAVGMAVAMGMTVTMTMAAAAIVAVSFVIPVVIVFLVAVPVFHALCRSL